MSCRDFADYMEKISRKREEYISLLASFVLTDTILFWTPEDCSPVRQQLQQAVQAANGILGTAYESTTGLNVSAENEAQEEKLRIFLQHIDLRQFTVLFLATAELRSVCSGFCLRKVS